MAGTGAPSPQDGICDGSSFGGPSDLCAEREVGCTASDCELNQGGIWIWPDDTPPAWPAYSIGALDDRFTMMFGDNTCEDCDGARSCRDTCAVPAKTAMNSRLSKCNFWDQQFSRVSSGSSVCSRLPTQADDVRRCGQVMQQRHQHNGG